MSRRLICYTNLFSLQPVRAGEAVTRDFITNLLDRGYEIDVIVPNFDGRERSLLEILYQKYSGRIRLHCVSSLSKDFVDKHIIIRFLLSVFWYIPLTVRGLFITNKDFILSMYQPTHFASIAASIVSYLKKKPHIIWVYDLFPVSSKKRIGLRDIPYLTLHKVISPALRMATISLYVSEEVRRHAITKYSITRQTGILPNLVDTRERLKINSPFLSVKKPVGSKLIVFLGEIFPSRLPTLELLLKAIASLIKKNYDIRLLLIGHGYGMEGFEKIVQQYDVHDYILTTGKVPNTLVPHYLKLADVAIGMLHTTDDAIGGVNLKMLEYMAAGLPIIIADACVTAGAIKNGENGILVPPNDEQAVANSIEMLINNDAFRSRLGRNAQEFVEKNYSVTAILDRFESYVEKIDVYNA